MTSVQPRRKDHWSVRLHIRRPGAGTGNPVVLLGLVLLQTVLLYLTASSFATSGSLYGCPAACGTAVQPTVPFSAVLLGVVTLALPVVIGTLCRTWRLAITLALVPWWLMVILHASTFLSPTLSFVPATSTTAPAHPGLVSQFSAPFWLDTAHLLALFLSLALFAALGALGWLGRQALAEW